MTTRQIPHKHLEPVASCAMFESAIIDHSIVSRSPAMNCRSITFVL